MKQEELEAGGDEVPVRDDGVALEWLAKGLLVLVALAVVLPFVIPLVALVGGLTLGLLGMTLGLALAFLGLLLKLTLLVLKLTLGAVGLALGLLPALAVVFLVLYLVDRASRREA